MDTPQTPERPPERPPEPRLPPRLPPYEPLPRLRLEYPRFEAARSEIFAPERGRGRSQTSA